ncbi:MULTISPECIES: DddA-like double-stranded DNA deaminase toxin [unclassified Micromonospora]|uniref:DddA-like double-stranded DNA deaminase toxin n=1 Tax=unclassified Micromonospora TaxID=2617518 RepID=UPI003A85D8C2
MEVGITSAGDIARSLDATRSGLARIVKALAAAGTAIHQQQGQLSELTRGASHPAASQAVAAAAAAVQRLQEAAELTSAAGRDLLDYTRRIIGEPTAAPSDRSGPYDATSSIAAGGRLLPDQVERLRSDLPGAVEPGTGQKTHGRWIDPDTGVVRHAISGKDDDQDRVDRHLRDEGIPRLPQRTGDIEMKVAMQMRDRGIRHLDIVLNNVPCRGRLGCDGMLPILLPEGSSITVHGPNFRKTYTGGARPWWR